MRERHQFQISENSKADTNRYRDNNFESVGPRQIHSESIKAQDKLGRADDQKPDDQIKEH